MTIKKERISYLLYSVYPGFMVGSAMIISSGHYLGYNLSLITMLTLVLALFGIMLLERLIPKKNG